MLLLIVNELCLPSSFSRMGGLADSSSASFLLVMKMPAGLCRGNSTIVVRSFLSFSALSSSESRQIPESEMSFCLTLRVMAYLLVVLIASAFCMYA